MRVFCAIGQATSLLRAVRLPVATAPRGRVEIGTRGELHPLEEGKHAAESGMDLKAYAQAAGKARQTLQHKVYAYRVLASVPHVGHADIRDSWRNLAEIHAAPNGYGPL